MKSTVCFLFCFLLFSSSFTFAKSHIATTNNTNNEYSECADDLVWAATAIGAGIVTSILQNVWQMLIYFLFPFLAFYMFSLLRGNNG